MLQHFRYKVFKLYGSYKFSGGLVYARKMRGQCFITMLDPIQRTFGPIPTILVYLASLLGDLLWTAAILSALGKFNLLC